MAYTMREVAKRAGVSPATVSRVLNRTKDISPETEKRVLDTVKRLNYYKNVHARRLSTGKSDLFGLIISEIVNPYFPELIRGFQTAAWDRGYDVLLCNTEYNLSRAHSVVRRLIENDVRGVAVMTASLGRTLPQSWLPPELALCFAISVRQRHWLAISLSTISAASQRRLSTRARSDTNERRSSPGLKPTARPSPLNNRWSQG